MKKIKYIVIAVICQVMLFTFIVPVVASGDSSENESPIVTSENGNDGEMSLEEQIAELTNQMNLLQAQMTSIQRNLSQIWGSFVDQSVEDDEISEQTTYNVLLEKHMFQMEYYNTCSIIVKNDLLNRQLTLTEKQREVERTRLLLGMSTQKSVDALDTRSRDIRQQIEINNETLRIKRLYVNTKSGKSGYAFISDYKIPVPTSPTAKSADEVRLGLYKNNGSLNSLNSQIKKQEDLLKDMRNSNANSASRNTLSLEIERLNSQQLLLIKQLELMALSGWVVYLDAKAQFDLAEAARPTIAAQIELNDELFRLGKISEVELLGRKYSAYEQLCTADIAAINLVIAVTELNAMMNGVAS